MTGTVTINGVPYQVGIPDLTPADVLPVFRTDTSILKTDSILLHAAGAQQNSAKKVLIPHLISLMSSAVAEDVVLTIEPYYDASGEYQGMYWHFNGQWLRRSDTGEMISVTDDAAEIALAAEQAVAATIDAKAATAAANKTEARVSEAEELRVQAEGLRVQQAAGDHTRAEGDHTTADADHTQAGQDHTRAEGDHTTADADHTTADADHTQAGQDHTRAEGDHTTADADHTQAGQDHTRAEGDHTRAGQDHTRANTDHANALSATEGAENVNAGLDGMKVTVTDRYGTSRSVDLSLDFYETYASVAAMNADLANIPKCALVSIATDDPLDDENAGVYQKRSDGTMKYICDLDQKSAAAWNDWLENKKPEIQQRIDTADADHQTATGDHTRAEGDHTTAAGDHTQAGQDHTRAEGDHTTADGDHTQAGQDHSRAENMHTHQPYIADGTAGHPGDAGYFYSWDYPQQQYVRGPKLSLDWSSMTQAERDALAQDILAAISFDSTPTENSTNAITSGGVYAMKTELEQSVSRKQDELTFASEQTCESIIDEIVHVSG